MTTPVLAGGLRPKMVKTSADYAAEHQRQVANNGGSMPVMSSEAKRQKMALVLAEPDGIRRIGVGMIGPIQLKSCGKHLNNKNVVDFKRYDDIEGTLWMHRCSCGTFTSIFLFDDDSKNVNFVKKGIPLE